MISERKTSSKLFAWSLVVIWMIVIFMFSSQKASDSAQTSSGFTSWILSLITRKMPVFQIQTMAIKYDFFVRKFAHFTIYTVLGLLVSNAFLHTSVKRKFLMSALLCIAYSISDEIHQMFVPGRACRLYDIGIDSLGSMVGILIYFALFYRLFINEKSNKLTQK